jgi:hypothetical protein
VRSFAGVTSAIQAKLVPIVAEAMPEITRPTNSRVGEGATAMTISSRPSPGQEIRITGWRQ